MSANVEMTGIKEPSNYFVSVRKLDVGKIIRYKPESDSQTALSELIQKVINIFNKKFKTSDTSTGNNVDESMYLKGKQTEIWDPQTEGNKNFQVVYYYRKNKVQCSFNTFINGSLGGDESYTNRNYDFIFFFHRTIQTVSEIFALTAAHSWFLVTNFTDFSFPNKIAKRQLDPDKTRVLELMHLVGDYANTHRLYRDMKITLTQSHFFSAKVTSMTCSFKVNASIQKILQPDKKKPESISVEIKLGSVRISKQIDLTLFPSILDHYSLIDRGRPTKPYILTDQRKRKRDQEGVSSTEVQNTPDEIDDPKFEFLDYVTRIEDKVLKKRLDTALIQEFCDAVNSNRMPKLSLSHRYLLDFFKSGRYRLFINDKMQKELSSCPSLENLIGQIKDKIPRIDQQSFQKIVFKFRRKGAWVPNSTKKFSLSFMHFLDGEIYVDKGYFFKAQGDWYCISSDFLTLVHKDIKEVIQQHLMKADDAGRLKKVWGVEKDEKGKLKPIKEAKYNESYIDESNFFVGDRIMLSGGIELFDLLQYNQDNTWIYHLKIGLAGNTRVVSSQILNAARLLNDTIMQTKGNKNTLKEFWDGVMDTQSTSEYRIKMKEKLRELGEDKFYKLFDKSKITFVLGFVDDKKEEKDLRNEANYLSQKEEFTEEERGLLKKMKLFDHNGYRTHVCFSMTQQEFITQSQEEKAQWNAKEIYKKLKPHDYGSTIAKLELINLRQELAALGFKFQICQIKRETPVLEESEGEGNLITELPEVSSSDEEDVEEENGQDTVIQETETQEIDEVMDDVVSDVDDQTNPVPFNFNGAAWVAVETYQGSFSGLHAFGIKQNACYGFMPPKKRIRPDFHAVDLFFNQLSLSLKTDDDVKRVYEKMMVRYLKEFHQYTLLLRSRKRTDTAKDKMTNAIVLFQQDLQRDNVYDKVKGKLDSVEETTFPELCTDQFLNNFKNKLQFPGYVFSEPEIELASYVFGKQVHVFEKSDREYQCKQTFNTKGKDIIVIFKGKEEYLRCEMSSEVLK